MLALAPRRPPLRPQWSSRSLGTPGRPDSPGRMGTALLPAGRGSRHPGMGFLYREVLTLPCYHLRLGRSLSWGRPVCCRMSVASIHCIPGAPSSWNVAQPQPLGGLMSPGVQNHSGRDPLLHITGLWPVETGWEDPGLPPCSLPSLASCPGSPSWARAHLPLSWASVRPHVMVSSTFWTSGQRASFQTQGKAPSVPGPSLYPQTADSGDAGPWLGVGEGPSRGHQPQALSCRRAIWGRSSPWEQRTQAMEGPDFHRLGSQAHCSQLCGSWATPSPSTSFPHLSDGGTGMTPVPREARGRAPA